MICSNSKLFQINFLVFKIIAQVTTCIDTIFMMKKLIQAILALSICLSVYAKHGVDLSSPTSFSTVQCFVQAGVEFFTIRGYTADGALDEAAMSTLRFVQQIGVPGDLYMESCRGMDATGQANDMLDSIPANLYNKVWISVQASKNKICDWSAYPAAGNCEFLKQLLAAVKGRGKTVGIYSDQYAWQNIFKTISGCPEVGIYPLWYGVNDHQDNFNNYKSFGGFGMPSQKSYAAVNDFCAMNGVGLDYRL